MVAGALLSVLLVAPVACTSNAGRQVAATTTTVTVRASTTTTSQLPATTAASNTWTKLNPSGTTPPVHLNPSMAYDSDTGHVIMFGGQGWSGLLSDTWAYDPATNTWTDLEPSGPLPSARAYSSITYDPDTHQVIMFGGDGSGFLNDTWAYDPRANTWTDLHPAGPVPSARAYHSMIYDPSAHRVIVFGGEGGTGMAPAFFGDTWAYDPRTNTWTDLHPSGTLPSGRAWQSTAYDSSTRQVVMFGGGTRFDLLNDTWAYDLAANTWTKLSPSGSLPSARANQAMAYDPDTAQVIMFGGSDGYADDLLDDTWAYDPSVNTWTDLKPSGSLPSGRDYYWMAYDPPSGRVIMIGGYNNAGSSGRNDAWAYTP
jgi:N-acetylneuraminic acid mutarotase